MLLLGLPCLLQIDPFTRCLFTVGFGRNRRRFPGQIREIVQRTDFVHSDAVVPRKSSTDDFRPDDDDQVGPIFVSLPSAEEIPNNRYPLQKGHAVGQNIIRVFGDTANVANFGTIRATGSLA